MLGEHSDFTTQNSMMLVVNRVAHKLLMYNASQSFDETVTDCLRLLGEALEKNRVYIWRDSRCPDGKLCCMQVYEWVKGVDAVQGHDEFENIPYEYLPNFQRALDQRECLNSRIHDLSFSEQSILGAQKIQSILVAPIIIDDVRWGFIGVDNCTSTNLFTKHEEQMLLTSGVMLASAILKQATETSLRQSEELVQAMTDATPLSCSVWNKDLKIITSNEGATKLFGLENKQQFMQYFYQLSPKMQPNGQLSTDLAHFYLTEAFRTGSCEFEWMHCNLAGQLIPVHVALVRIKYKHEDAVASYVRDLRELKKQEALRCAAEERNELMLNAMPLCCNFWDKNFNNTACNDKAVRLFDLSSQQEYLERFQELSPARQPNGRLSSEMALEKIQQAFAEGHAHFEWMHQKLDGTPIPAEITLRRLMFQNEHVVVGYTRDLREHKAMLAEIEKAQKELALARDEALELSKAKGDFLANMSHEIRTPMNGIIGLSYLALQQPDIAPQLRDYIEKIDDSAKSLLRIINDILDFSKIAAGKLDMEQLPFSLTKTLEHAIQPLIPGIEEKGLKISLDFAPDVPTQLIGDAIRLRQVVLNLVANALKFTHEGGIVIHVELLSQTNSTATLRFSVQDTGIGISPEYLSHMFEAFSQADTSITRRYGGTGLGLAISKQIVTLLGGEMSVSSTVDVGSIFSFTAKFPLRNPHSSMHKKEPYIHSRHHEKTTQTEPAPKAPLENSENTRGPAATTEMTAATTEMTAATTEMTAVTTETTAVTAVTAVTAETTAAPAIAPPSQTQPPNNPQDAPKNPPMAPPAAQPKVKTPDIEPAVKVTPLTGKRVLLAEDNEINQLIASSLLAGFGMSVALAGTGQEAVQQALAEPFDAILMDIQMPEMDGIEAAKLLRSQHPHLNRTPIIAMTALAMEDDRTRCLKAGMQAHITKPISPDNLYEVLLRWIHTAL